jgi:hypothetical protein
VFPFPIDSLSLTMGPTRDKDKSDWAGEKKRK